MEGGSIRDEVSFIDASVKIVDFVLQIGILETVAIIRITDLSETMNGDDVYEADSSSV